MGRYLVTGGGGFIGSHIVERLVRDGRSVRVLDNFSTGRRENLAGLEERIELMEGDIRRPEDCRRACEGIEVVFHQAALPSVPTSIERPAETHDANVNGTFNMLMAARDAGCRRLIYAASSSAYGDQPQSPKVESMVPDPMSPYALQKLTGEYYCRVFRRCWGLETVALRYFNVFGPRQNPRSQYAAAIPAFVSAILRNEPPTVYGDGEQTRDFTYIDNVVAANLLAAEAPEACGQVINAACGQSISINAIIGLINAILGRSVRPVYAPRRPGDVRDSLADIGLARRLLGFEPVVLFEEGLRRAIAWYRDNL